MIILGVTGSIGMGKSTISKMLQKLNIPIHDSDLEVKKLIEDNDLVKKKIKQIWPRVISYQNNNETINKYRLGEIIFKNSKDKKRLEKIIHPLIHINRKNFVKRYLEKKYIVAIDVPLLYETNTNEICDYIFLALTSEKKQKERVLSRLNMTEEKLNLIKDNQWSDQNKKNKKPFIISTSYGKTFTFILIIIYLSIILIKGKQLKI